MGRKSPRRRGAPAPAPPPPPLALLLALASLASLGAAQLGAVALAQGLPVLRPRPLASYSDEGPYAMGMRRVNAPKQNSWKRGGGFGTAPINVYYPVARADCPSSVGGGVVGRFMPTGFMPNACAGKPLARDGRVFPAIGFSHGAGATAEIYDATYRHLVSNGYVVISVRNPVPTTVTLGEDICHGLAWVLDQARDPSSEFHRRIDTSGFGTAGHSMGGGGAAHCAAAWPQQIKAFAPLHPAPGAMPTALKAPMLVPNGNMDFTTSPLLVKAAVYDGSQYPKIMPIMAGAGHLEPVDYTGRQRWTEYVLAFFDLYLKGDLRAAYLIWGTNTGALSKDSRMSVVHMDPGMRLALDRRGVQVGPGGLATVDGKISTTLANPEGAAYAFAVFQRDPNGMQVDATVKVVDDGAPAAKSYGAPAGAITRTLRGGAGARVASMFSFLSQGAQPAAGPKASSQNSQRFRVEVALPSAAALRNGRQTLTVVALNMVDRGTAAFADIEVRGVPGSPSGGWAPIPRGWVASRPQVPSVFHSLTRGGPSPARPATVQGQLDSAYRGRADPAGPPPFGSAPAAGFQGFPTQYQSAPDFFPGAFEAAPTGLPKSTSDRGGTMNDWASVVVGRDFGQPSPAAMLSPAAGPSDFQSFDGGAPAAGGMFGLPSFGMPSFGLPGPASFGFGGGPSFGNPLGGMGIGGMGMGGLGAGGMSNWINRFFPTVASFPGAGIVLGVSTGVVGYGDPEAGVPTPKDRSVHLWMNTVRMDPAAFRSSYGSRGCAMAEFAPDERLPKRPLLMSRDLVTSAKQHSDDMAENDFVSHIGSDRSSPFDRMERVGYGDGFRGENIAAGMREELDVVLSWMCSPAHRENVMSDDFVEAGIALRGSLGTRYTHYWTANYGNEGSLVGGQFVSENQGSQQGILVGVHRPEEPTNEVEFSADFYDPAGRAPRGMSVVVNGFDFPMSLRFGQKAQGVYSVGIQTREIGIFDAISGQSPCIAYFFRATDAAGRAHTFPEVGSYGFGGCDFDDAGAKWIESQNATSVSGLATEIREAPEAFAGTPSAQPQVVCLGDQYQCADGTMVQRTPPSCQFFCEAGAPPLPAAREVSDAAGGAPAPFLLQAPADGECARTWTDFMSGQWVWCDEVLDSAEADPQNPWRWIIPLWRELQSIDWVAASSAMTEYWQNLEQCRIYVAPIRAPLPIADGQQIRANLLVAEEPLESIKRVSVRVDVQHPAPRTLSMGLVHRNGQAMASSTLYDGPQADQADNGIGFIPVVLDDFGSSPFPGWWSSYLPKSNAEPSGEVEYELDLSEGRYPIVQPYTGLIALAGPGGSLSSSLGDWDLVVQDTAADGATGTLDDFSLVICGQPLRSEFSWSSQSLAGDKCTAPAKVECSEFGCLAGTTHFCGTVSTVGAYSTQPPPAESNMQSLTLSSKTFVQPVKGSSAFCSRPGVPLSIEMWVQPRMKLSGLDIDVHTFYTPAESLRGTGSPEWTIVDSTATVIPDTDIVHLDVPTVDDGCLMFALASKRGSGAYDAYVKID